METRKLVDLEQIEKIYRIYMKNDFADDELRPWHFLKASWFRDEYCCYGLFQESQLLGYAFFVRLPHGEQYDYLFDYLGILKERRGEGLGSVFLGQIAPLLADAYCIVGEMEDPDAAVEEKDRAVRERRRRFYLKNGYLETTVRSRVFGVEYRIFEVPTAFGHEANEIVEIYKRLYQSILPPEYFRNCFEIL